MQKRKSRVPLSFVPVFIYLGMQISSSLVVSIIYIMKYFLSGGSLDYNSVYSYVLYNSPTTLLSTFFAVISTICILVLLGDKIFSRKEREIEVTSVKKKGRLSLWEGFGLFSSGVFVVYLVNLIITNTSLWESYQSTSESINEMLNGPFLLMFITIAILTPIAEELVFRAGLFKGLKKDIPMWGAILISSIVFGVLHGNLIQGVYTALLGIIICVAYEKYSSIWAAILIHMGFNFLSSIDMGVALLKNATVTNIANIVYIILAVMGCIFVGMLLFKSDFPKGNTFKRDSSKDYVDYFEE